MINFFRKIRSKSLTENRSGKYLLYAIGEILLVVIGILIALQINTWSENAKNQRNEFSFYRDILSDLEKDSIKLYELKVFYKNRIEQASWHIRKLRDPSSSIESEEFSKHIEPLYFGPLPVSYNATYEAAKSSGSFASYNNGELLKDLNQFYADFNDLKGIAEATLRLLESTLEPLMSTIPENYITLESGAYVITSELHDNKGFYEFIEDIEDKRELTVDIKSFMQKPQFEFYLIGDLGRSFNALASLKIREEQRSKIETEIRAYIND